MVDAASELLGDDLEDWRVRTGIEEVPGFGRL